MDDVRTSLINFLLASSDIDCISTAKVVPIFRRLALQSVDEFREGRRRVHP